MFRARRSAFVLAALFAGAASPACACRAPSADVDGGDLLGVFAHDGGRDGAADGGDAGAPRGKRRGKDGGAGPPKAAASSASSATTRAAPGDGMCAAPAGEPSRDVRRTLGRPPCRGAQVSEWKDADGSPRYACIYAPPGVETRAPLPLLVFFHDEDDDPSAVAKKTGFAKSNATADLTGDAAHRGFVVLAPQGRHINGGKRGSVFDAEYTGADNVDVATVDHFIADLDKKGLVDGRRVYALGASLGGHMAATYAMMRADKVAAFATYASDAPAAAWSCGGPPPPAFIAYRACDGFISCEAAERWLRARDDAHAETTWLRLGPSNEVEPSCTVRNKCTPKKAEASHHRWPKTREGDLLAFLARHALGPAQAPPGAPARDPDDEPGE
jgi:dienelactone hydrolase